MHKRQKKKEKKPVYDQMSKRKKKKKKRKKVFMWTQITLIGKTSVSVEACKNRHRVIILFQKEWLHGYTVDTFKDSKF